MNGLGLMLAAAAVAAIGFILGTMFGPEPDKVYGYDDAMAAEKRLETEGFSPEELKKGIGIVKATVDSLGYEIVVADQAEDKMGDLDSLKLGNEALVLGNKDDIQKLINEIEKLTEDNIRLVAENEKTSEERAKVGNFADRWA